MDCNFSTILHDKWDSLITDLEIKLSSKKEGEILRVNNMSRRAYWRW